MYIKSEHIKFAINDLASLHPFYGITYLVCKSNNLPVGQAIEFPINYLETEFLSHYCKPVENSEKFFRVFRPSDKNKFWLNNDYASSGSQANRTQFFVEAFIHPKNSNLWGWSIDYIDVLASLLKGKKIPAYSLALWILKDTNLANDSSPADILSFFIEQFNLNNEELQKLFNLKLPSWLSGDFALANEIYEWDTVANLLQIPPPPDLPLEKGGALVSLEFRNFLPYEQLRIDLSSRLNIITGDNGLGKSFILESAWWALTGSWTSFPLYPDYDRTKTTPAILYHLSAKKGRDEAFTSYFNWRMQDWELDKTDKKTVPGLVIYAQVDGAFAIWDPARIYSETFKDSSALPIIMVLSRQEIWDGVRIGDGSRSRSIFNGLITDWVHWQTSDNESFEILKKVLKRLSPPDLLHGDLGVLEPGEIVRIPNESRPIPTIKHPYGEVPIVFASAAVKRIIALAYLIVWTWEEHKTSARLIREEPQSKMVVIADEIESHLHPQWQRVIMPALTTVSNDLSKNLEVQFLVTTHSPLVMASVEPFFDEKVDSIFHLKLVERKIGGAKIALENIEFEKKGSADSWLMSDIFELRQPRSIEAERAITEAQSIQKNNNASKEEIFIVNQKLLSSLPSHDKFWVRWNYFLEQHDIAI